MPVNARHFGPNGPGPRPVVRALCSAQSSPYRPSAQTRFQQTGYLLVSSVMTLHKVPNLLPGLGEAPQLLTNPLPRCHQSFPPGTFSCRQWPMLNSSDQCKHNPHPVFELKFMQSQWIDIHRNPNSAEVDYSSRTSPSV